MTMIVALVLAFSAAARAQSVASQLSRHKVARASGRVCR